MDDAIMQPRTLTRFIVLSLSLAAAATLSACASRQATGTTSQPSYVVAFSQGRYQQAFDEASKASASLRGVRQDEASLITGLSAQALNKNAEAVVWLTPLEKSGDAQICGRACATLGLISQERGEHAQAVTWLTKAGTKLKGDESARAFMYAGDSYRALGKSDEARDAYTTAQARVATDINLRAMIGDRMQGAVPTTVLRTPPGPTKPSVLTVQAGAFSSLTTARQQMVKINEVVPAARIVPIRTHLGQRLYAVRVGRFSSREAAERVRSQLGRSAVVTVATGEQ